MPGHWPPDYSRTPVYRPKRPPRSPAGPPGEAVPQFEKALAAAKVEGYAKETRARLDQARAAAGK